MNHINPLMADDVTRTKLSITNPWLYFMCVPLTCLFGCTIVINFLVCLIGKQCCRQLIDLFGTFR